MANIASQKKRILRSERERLENRLYTSTIRTYFRRLEAAVANSVLRLDRQSPEQGRGENFECELACCWCCCCVCLRRPKNGAQ